MEIPAASRYEKDRVAMRDWPEYHQLVKETREMLQKVVRPPTAHGTIIGLAAIGDFSSMLEAVVPPEGLASRGSRHAATLVSEVLQECLANANLADAPSAAQAYLCNKDTKAWAVLNSYLGAPGNDEPLEQEDDILGGSNVVLHLSRVQTIAAQLTHRSALQTPIVACSLSQDMLTDRAMHPVFFQAAAKLQDIHGNLFASRKSDPAILWSNHMTTSGKIAHPARPPGELAAFEVQDWMGTLENPGKATALGHMMTEYPLPDFASLRFCFKPLSSHTQAARGQKRSRDQRDRSYAEESRYIDRDTVNALALLCGDLVYALNLHLGDILPALGHGPNRPIPHKAVDSKALLLGLFFQLAINYQTCNLALSFDDYLINDINHSLSFPITGAVNFKKLIALALAPPNLGPKRKAALPYLITSRGLRGYQTYLSDPDLYISRLHCLAGSFLDESTGVVAEAKHRITLRDKQTVHHNEEAATSGTTPSATITDPVSPKCNKTLFIIHFINRYNRYKDTICFSNIAFGFCVHHQIAGLKARMRERTLRMTELSLDQQ